MCKEYICIYIYIVFCVFVNIVTLEEENFTSKFRLDVNVIAYVSNFMNSAYVGDTEQCVSACKVQFFL